MHQAEVEPSLSVPRSDSQRRSRAGWQTMKKPAKTEAGEQNWKTYRKANTVNVLQQKSCLQTETKNSLAPTPLDKATPLHLAVPPRPHDLVHRLVFPLPPGSHYGAFCLSSFSFREKRKRRQPELLPD